MTFIDTLGVPEFFAEALTRVERVGPNRRLVFTVTQPDESGAAVVKLVVSWETAVCAATMLLNDSPEPLAFASIPISAAN
jgi:hypothetical protein